MAIDIVRTRPRSDLDQKGAYIPCQQYALEAQKNTNYNELSKCAIHHQDRLRCGKYQTWIGWREEALFFVRLQRKDREQSPKGQYHQCGFVACEEYQRRQQSRKEYQVVIKQTVHDVVIYWLGTI